MTPAGDPPGRSRRINPRSTRGLTIPERPTGIVVGMNDQLFSVAVSVLIGLAAVALVLYRQLRVRQLRQGIFKAPLILCVIGVLQIGEFCYSGGAVTAAGVVSAGIALVVAAALAWPRAQSMKVWQDDEGVWWGQGTWLSVLLWAVTIGAHVGITLLVPWLMGETVVGNPLTTGLESKTLLLYLGVSLGLQAWFREQRLTTASDEESSREPAGLR